MTNFKMEITSLLFLKSAFSHENSFITTNEIINWVKLQNDSVNVEINKIPFNKLKHWKFDSINGKLSHETGNFFSIDGINVNTNWGAVASWDQPIINQPEIGFLGFLTKEFNGILHFLIQAKIEPGNVNYVQLSPTLQATKSNYTRVHKGKAPEYLDYFINATTDQILLDQLQSEQGGRFLRKRNRNIIIKIEEEIPLLKGFIWVTLAQIKDLMQVDNLVNMDTRTVISGIPYGSYSFSNVDFFTFLDKNKSPNSFESMVLRSTLTADIALYNFDSIIMYVTKQKVKYDLNVNKLSLYSLKNWKITDFAIQHIDNKYFKIIATEINIGNREVVSWTQPMVEPAQEGICAFVCKEIKGILHFAIQTKLECGNFDIIEFAPTVQCLTGNYRDSINDNLPFPTRLHAAAEPSLMLRVLH
jgi:oxidase EvaA